MCVCACVVTCVNVVGCFVRTVPPLPLLSLQCVIGIGAYVAPTDCVYGPWSPWSVCEAAGSGMNMTSRSRPIVTPAANGGSPCADATESRACGGASTVMWRCCRIVSSASLECSDCRGGARVFVCSYACAHICMCVYARAQRRRRPVPSAPRARTVSPWWEQWSFLRWVVC